MFMQPDNGQVGVDTGCGAGELVVEMAPYFKKLIGIDYSQSMVEKANKYTNESNVTNVQLYLVLEIIYQFFSQNILLIQNKFTNLIDIQ